MSAILERPDVVKYLCKYQVANLILMWKDQKWETNATNILGIEYLCNYDTDLRAVLKVSLRMDIRQKLWILQHKREIVAKIELDAIGIDHETELYKTKPEHMWNLECEIFLDDDNESMDVSLLESRLSMNEGTQVNMNALDTENYFESQNTLEIFLVNGKLMDASQHVCNVIEHADTLQQLVGEILTESKHKDVLMSSIENRSIQKELLVPALPAYQCISYLDQYEGLYKSGAMLFYDIDACYLLNCNGSVTAKRKDEWTMGTFLISKIDDATPGEGMVRVPNEKIYYVVLNEQNAGINKPSMANDIACGSLTTLVDAYNGTQETMKATQAYRGTQHERVISDDTDFSKSVVKARMEENEAVLYIYARNLDIRAFKPNKRYQVVFDETTKQQKYGSMKFRLSYAYHYIHPEGESFMSSTHILVLKRCS